MMAGIFGAGTAAELHEVASFTVVTESICLPWL